ncbi:serine/threonine phosphatase [Roseofilum sp. BLCC_M154]|uniref:Serine/threonine phosphatase n=1 Tax=Roseofilum acuticapitatum BLCC-M154 TaxID=3022444 RepID=A0ABT7AZ65_9CYAN|nr:serine/threonine phosphatase [Roseofilum acuticapitatum]MDJ1171724.1 serine/threonine phosphatase [Roseofilum acuticapitatum BLCC-M154]
MDISPDAQVIVPELAQIYRELESKLDEMDRHRLPSLQESWVEGEEERVMILEDRSDWKKVVELWREENMPSEQIIFMFHEMLDLWEQLETVHCRQSLLEVSNLLLDEDEILCLQCLHLDTNPEAVSLKELGKLWQQLFQQSEMTQVGSLLSLLQDLQAEKMTSVDQVRDRLEEILAEEQGDPDFDHSPESLASLYPEEEADQDKTQPIDYSDYSPSGFNLSTPNPMPSPPTSPFEDMPTVVLPMQLFSLDYAGVTDKGMQRDHNEDSFLIHTQLERIEDKTGRTIHAKGLYILCDGMGGHAGGEQASMIGVKTLKEYFQTHWFNLPHSDSRLPSTECIEAGIFQANQAIYDINQSQSRTGSGRMGTTLVLVLIQDVHVAVAHVGDSRLYMFSRKQGLTLLTQDHDVAQREIKRGLEPELAFARPDAYQLTQALGPRHNDFVKPDIYCFELNQDSLLLLSSDGLTDNDLVEKHVGTHIEPLMSSRANLERGVGDLIDLANEHNGHDNITVVLVRAKVRPNLGGLSR